MFTVRLPALIFWSIANCTTPIDVAHMIKQLNNLSQEKNLSIMNMNNIHIVDNSRELDPELQKDLSQHDISLEYSKKNTFNLLDIIIQYPIPLTIILIGNDSDFIPLIMSLKVKGYYIISIYYDRPIYNAHTCISWNNFIQGVYPIIDRTHIKRLYNRYGAQLLYKCYRVEFFNTGAHNVYYSDMDYEINDIVKVEVDNRWDIGKITDIRTCGKKPELKIIKKITTEHFAELLKQKVDMDTNLLNSYRSLAAKIIPNIKIISVTHRWDLHLIYVNYINIDKVKKTDLEKFKDSIKQKVPVKLNYIWLCKYSECSDINCKYYHM